MINSQKQICFVESKNMNQSLKEQKTRIFLTIYAFFLKNPIH